MGYYGGYTTPNSKSNRWIGKPLGEWNTMTVECLNNSFKVWVNKELVNKGFAAAAEMGQIALQTEGSEVKFRRVELTPIYRIQ